MANATSKKRLHTLHVNDRTISVQPDETVLDAALREGIDFPNDCRVGGCGTCRCRLTSGSVTELTETAYLLSRREIDEGYILACQSVPESDVRVEVGVTDGPRKKPAVHGYVITQEKVTHDIVHLRVQLAGPIAYKPGQYARVSLDGVTRSYSFATPPDEHGEVSFFIRRVPGGVFSTRVVDEDVTGREVTVEGPLGEFWLREGEGPLLLVAGGSGLAPILAMLEAAVKSGDTRPVTLLFGARERRDLYALEQIEGIARRWKGTFRFVPVLSAEGDTAWSGARGNVTEHIPEALSEGVRAYLCGPPAMIDRAIELLRARGVADERVRFDRFTTTADTASPARPATSASKNPAAGVLDYAKFFMFHAVGLFALTTLLAGGPWITTGLVAVLFFYMAGDAISGDDTETPTYQHPWILTAQLWLALPLLALIVFAAVWSVSPGDPSGFGAWVTRVTGYDVLAARAATAFGHKVSAGVATGLMIGMIGTITAHELTHRTWDRVSMFFGRWLLAFSFDTSFAIEHVYGHHRYVATESDPATAPRGRNVYHHIVASTVKGNVSAWKIEAARLAKRGHGVFSWHNRFLRGHLMSVALVAGAYAMGGLKAAGFFIACALWGKSLLEIVNYMEHYGIVRDPATPVEPRHSWNTNRRLSSWTMFNLTRHSHHHAQGEVPYHALRAYPEAPMMINGYLTTIVVALIPPLWHRLMTPKVLAWDRDYATDTERRLAARANARSGVPALVDASK